MKTDKTKALCFTCLLSVMAFGLMAIIGTMGGCSSEEGEGGGSIGSSEIRLNEVLFFASTGPEWVELYNTGSDAMDIGLFQISNEKGDTYDIPEELPIVPPGGYVVILFDGLGYNQNDYDFDDGYAVLHTNTLSGDVFDNASDSCTLYSGSFGNSGSKVDFVAWGDYAHDGHYVNNAEGYGSIGPVKSNQSIGVHPDVYTALIRVHWVIYAENETTQGKKNAIPAPVPVSPYENWQIGVDKVSFAWTGWFINIKEFHLEMDNNDDFNSPMISAKTKGSVYHYDASLQDGKYYWRVKAITKNSEESLWSQTYTFEIKTETRSPLRLTLDLMLYPPLLQRKDTHLLCPACPAKSTTIDLHHWDAPHICSPESAWSCPHCKLNCVRASVAMINHYFDGKVSQDRIAYAMYGTVANKHYYAAQLGHMIGGAASEYDVTKALRYALKDKPSVWAEDITFSKVMNYIVQMRPLVVSRPGHAMVIDGFDQFGDSSENWVHIIDPWTGKEMPVRLSTSNLRRIWAPPADSKGIKEENLKVDFDEDGITDFDEINRFLTDPKNSDTDGDGIPDKVEIWAWAYGKGTKPRRPDMPGGIWVTSNYDYDLYEDGDEDLNKNGNVDPGECDPFVADTPIKITFKIGGATADYPKVLINGKHINFIPTTGTSTGYHEREVLFLWCGGKLTPGGGNYLYIMACKAPFYDKIGDYEKDLRDDIQVRDIKIIDENNNVLLNEPGPFHIGNDNLQKIKSVHKEGNWRDPNPPEPYGPTFWTGLIKDYLELHFKWNG